MGTVTRLSTGQQGITPAAAVAAYLATLSATTTRRTYGLVLDAFAERFSDVTDVGDIGSDELAEWFTSRWGERSPARWNACRSALRSAYGYWIEQEWVSSDATRRLRRPRSACRPGPCPDSRPGRGSARRGRTWRSGRRRSGRCCTRSAARSAEVLGLDVEDLDMANRCARVTRKGGDVDLITWQSRTATLLPRLLKGRKTGPVFLTDRRVRSDVPRSLADIDPDTGRGRLTYATAQELFKAATGGKSLHQLRHSALSHLAETGANTSMMMARSGRAAA